MMNKEQKSNYINEMETKFQNNNAVLVTHYQGLTMTQLDELRSKMREHGIQFKITKNRITKLAIEKTKCKDLSNLFKGATAVAFSADAIMSARILSKFAKENENLKNELNFYKQLFISHPNSAVFNLHQKTKNDKKVWVDPIRDTVEYLESLDQDDEIKNWLEPVKCEK